MYLNALEKLCQARYFRYNVFMNIKLKQKILRLPQKPGTYLFKNGKARVIYVGKAKNLRVRARSYFLRTKELEPDKQIMVQEIRDLDYIVVDSELEALFLENNLIKKYHPKYNLRIKDDKFFVFIKIALNEEYPRVLTVRRINKKEQANYFGPYTSAKTVRRTMKVLRKLFPYRSCNILPKKPCLEYDLGKCIGPCLGKVKRSDYQKIINQVVAFLQGKSDSIIVELKKEMQQAAKVKDFERAAKLRDRINDIEEIIERQKVISPKQENIDLVSLLREENLGVVNLFKVRQGKLIGRENFVLENIKLQEDNDLIETFLEGYYTVTQDLPREIILEQEVSNKNLIKGLTKARVTVSKKGDKKKLLKLGLLNAREFLIRNGWIVRTAQEEVTLALGQLTKILKLQRKPSRIEAYDISNIQGQLAVGSMIVFKNGLPQKSEYRRFQIKKVKKVSDVDMMREILTRRFKRASQLSKSWPRPDLIVIDGGRAQLNVARDVLNFYKLKIPYIALAKREEEIYLPSQKETIKLTPGSKTLQLIQRIRDEAHRFAITYYRQRHGKKLVDSALDQIPGVGPKTKKALIRKFGSVEGIKRASEKDLGGVVGKKLGGVIKRNI